MSLNRLHPLFAFAAPLALATALWLLGALPAIEAWRWKTALVIQGDPLAMALMFLASMIFAGRALDILRTRYAAAEFRRSR